jgi:hypothetical protein
MVGRGSLKRVGWWRGGTGTLLGAADSHSTKLDKHLVEVIVASVAEHQLRVSHHTSVLKGVLATPDPDTGSGEHTAGFVGGAQIAATKIPAQVICSTLIHALKTAYLSKRRRIAYAVRAGTRSITRTVRCACTTKVLHFCVAARSCHIFAGTSVPKAANIAEPPLVFICRTLHRRDCCGADHA